MQPTILYGILNWGLGHATRSMPIIDSLIKLNCNVKIASDGEALEFLKKEYPTLDFYNLPGYNVKYPYKSIVFNIFLYSYSIIKAIIYEYFITKQIVQTFKPDLIISDNRYGFRSPKIRSILISHQINLELGNSTISKVGSWFNKILIRKFDKLWIPDIDDDKRLAGKLSIVENSINHQYIGLLSRLKPKVEKEKYDIAVVLSGPEPQRTKLENLLIKQLSNYIGKIILIKGKVLENENFKLNPNFEIKSHVLSKELNDIINQSKLIISRSGYTTVMDLVILGSKAIFIPTTGQTEQEYLANYLKENKLFYSEVQDKFNLEKSLEEVKDYECYNMKNDTLEKIIIEEINSFPNKK